MSYNPIAQGLSSAPSGTGGGISIGSLSGVKDGVNATFTLPAKPTNGVVIYKNGMIQHPGSGTDYIYDGNVTITFAAENLPQSGDMFAVHLF